MKAEKIFIPMIGLETWFNPSIPGDDMRAVVEATICFCMASERYGMGIEKELEAVEQDLNTNNYGTGSTESVL